MTCQNDPHAGHLRIISISAGPTEYCNFRRAMKRVWEYTTGREDHCIKHFLVTKVNSEAGGIIRITLCGKLHSIFDRPATCFDGTKLWYKHGKRHRDNDLPAVIASSGMRKWYQYGKLHRDNDQPATTDSFGSQEWWQHGKCHRDNDLPAVVYSDGGQLWCQYGKFHRDNGQPAIINSYGQQEWFQHGVEYTP